MYESQVSSSSYPTWAIRLEIENYHVLTDVFGAEFSAVVRSCVISRLLALGVCPGVTAYSEGIFVIRYSRHLRDSFASYQETKKLMETIRSCVEGEPVESTVGRAYLKSGLKECPSIDEPAPLSYDISDIHILKPSHNASSARMDLMVSASLLDELRKGKMILAFQPITLLVPSSESVVLYNEALLRRCSSDTQETYSWPSAIEALERTGLISRLDFSVIWTILSLLDRHPTQYIGCNLSASTIKSDSHWDSIIEHLDKHRQVAQRLTLEITETSNFVDMDESLKILSTLRACGVGVAIDDFGTGHTSIQHLAKIRPDIVKIDRSVLLRSRDPHYSPDLLRNLTKVCHDYTPCVVIEGIESAEELAAAKYAGAQCIQGFLVQHPETEPAWLYPHQAVVSDLLADI